MKCEMKRDEKYKGKWVEEWKLGQSKEKEEGRGGENKDLPLRKEQNA